MFDAETSALLQAVLEELCEKVPPEETATRARVAAKIFEAASAGERSIEQLKEAGRRALTGVPTMWR